MGNASFYFKKQRSCKWCFHLKTCGKYLVGCEKQGWKKIVIDIKSLYIRGGSASFQSREFIEKALRCKHFKTERLEKFL